MWVRGADGEPFMGDVWPEDPVYFVDFTNPTAQEWWVEEIVKFHSLVPWDGLWIDMNEPASQVLSKAPVPLLRCPGHGRCCQRVRGQPVDEATLQDPHGGAPAGRQDRVCRRRAAWGPAL